jgi:glutathione S-transferase
MSRTLYGLSVSPWSERARWALEHHDLAYAYHEHVPMIGELLLRRKAGVKKATVPLLADGDLVVMGSVPIARHADKVGRGEPLFPRGKDAEIDRWVEKAERMMEVGRAWLTRRLLANKATQAEALPSFVPGILRGAFAPSAAMAVRFIAKKHAVPENVDAEVQRTLRPLLQELGKAVRESGSYLVGSSFSAADLVLAATIHIVRPHERAKLGPLTREAWTNDALVADFGDLLEWRDAIYAKHR